MEMHEQFGFSYSQSSLNLSLRQEGIHSTGERGDYLYLVLWQIKYNHKFFATPPNERESPPLENRQVLRPVLTNRNGQDAITVQLPGPNLKITIP